MAHKPSPYRDTTISIMRLFHSIKYAHTVLINVLGSQYTHTHTHTHTHNHTLLLEPTIRRGAKMEK